MGYISHQSETYVSLGTVKTHSPSHWSGSMAIITMIGFIIMAWTMTHFLQHQHDIIHFNCIIMSYHSMIMTLWYSQFSWPTQFLIILSLPGLSLDLHSFDYLSLSHFCSPLTQPLPCSFYYYLGVIFIMATLVYVVVDTWCSSLAFKSWDILSPLTLFSAAATAKSYPLSNLSRYSLLHFIHTILPYTDWVKGLRWQISVN